MHPEIQNKFNSTILHAVRGKFGIDSKLRLLDGFESFIYEFERDGEWFILRVSHSSRRTENHIHGEMEWINYLSDNGINTCRGVPSPNGNLVESVDDQSGGTFIASVFHKAPGTPSWETEWTPGFVQHYGELMGNIHALSKEYKPAHPDLKRYAWDDPVNLEIYEKLPDSEITAGEIFQSLVSHFGTLPKDRSGYGLIHQDAHGGNFFVDDGTIWLFDFDDSVYGWFIYDIAMVIFYNLHGNTDDRKTVDDFLVNFFTGYYRKNYLCPEWFSEIPNFLKFREIDLYAAILHDFGPSYVHDSWCRNYMNGRKENIDKNRPFIGYDWQSIIDRLELPHS